MIALYLIAAHMLGDYILQTQRMSEEKLWSNWALFLHVTLYTLCFVPVVWWVGLVLWKGWFFLTAVWAGHAVVDSRRWIKDHPWPLKSLFVDQTLHMVCLAITGAVFGL